MQQLLLLSRPPTAAQMLPVSSIPSSLTPRAATSRFCNVISILTPDLYSNPDVYPEPDPDPDLTLDDVLPAVHVLHIPPNSAAMQGRTTARLSWWTRAVLAASQWLSTHSTATSSAASRTRRAGIAFLYSS